MMELSQLNSSKENHQIPSLALRLSRFFIGVALTAVVSILPGWAAESGISKTTIRIGGVMDLEGDSRGLGLGMKTGIEAALKDQSIQERAIEFVALNDFYNPQTTVEATRQLIEQGIFLMLGNVGTPTAKVSLPILAEHKVPAVGFFTGAGLLRPGVGDIVNYRASYVQETASVIEAALSVGVKPREICAYVQNDAYGMAGVAGIKTALTKHPGTSSVVERLEQIMALEGENPDRNGIGPVGVYRRNTLSSRDGYKSLKDWEQGTGTHCRLVVTVGTYEAIANFVGYAHYKGESWVFSAVSFTGADNLQEALKAFGITDGLIMTQVVPALDSSLPIVKDAHNALGDSLGYVALEGYIVGRMLLDILRNIKGPVTREAFLEAVRGHTFDLGGLPIDFSNDNQGSDLVLLTQLSGNGYNVADPLQLEKVFQ